jgi:hypothetical protein
MLTQREFYQVATALWQQVQRVHSSDGLKPVIDARSAIQLLAQFTKDAPSMSFDVDKGTMTLNGEAPKEEK